MSPACFVTASEHDLTPVKRFGEYLVKREDLFEVHGINGCKVREALALCKATGQGLVGYGGRRSTTAAALAAAGKAYGKPVRFHTAAGEWTEEMHMAKSLGAEIIQHWPGYLNVLRARAVADADKHGLTCGLEYTLCIDAVTLQTENLLSLGTPKRIVVAAGACIVLAGVVNGLKAHGWDIPMIGVVVGADPNMEFLNSYASGWEKFVTFEKCKLRYDQPARNLVPWGLRLDPLYEGKAAMFLSEGDLLWNSGIRAAAQ